MQSELCLHICCGVTSDEKISANLNQPADFFAIRLSAAREPLLNGRQEAGLQQLTVVRATPELNRWAQLTNSHAIRTVSVYKYLYFAVIHPMRRARPTLTNPQISLQSILNVRRGDHDWQTRQIIRTRCFIIGSGQPIRTNSKTHLCLIIPNHFFMTWFSPRHPMLISCNGSLQGASPRGLLRGPFQ